MNTINTILLLQPAGSPQKSSPPLGLGYVATYLKHKLPQIRIKIIDLLVENVDLAEELNSYRPDLIGVTGTTPAAKFMRHLFDRIRSLNPNIPIVVGGPHASAMKTGVFYMSVDFAVIGEGEETFVDLVNALNSRKNLAEVDGLIYRDANGSIIENKKRAYISDIDTIPMVDRSLFKMEKYASKGTLISTRGCPYNCIFCSQSFGRGWRAHSPEYVFNEIKEMVTRYGARTIRLMDDNPLIKKSRFQDICNLVINSNFFKKVRFELNHGTRMDIVDKEIFLLLKKIGIKKMWFGLESINADVRKGMRKQLSLDNIERAIEIAQSLGMMVNAFITIGMPGDNYEKSMETMRYVKKKKDRPSFTCGRYAYARYRFI